MAATLQSLYSVTKIRCSLLTILNEQLSAVCFRCLSRNHCNHSQI